MNNEAGRALDGWAKFLNPESLRSNLVSAAMFLTAYEMLRSTIIDRIRNFYTHEFRGGEWIPSPDYQARCLSRHSSPLRASLMWLQEMSVVNDADLSKIDDIRQHRNALAHDLPTFLISIDQNLRVDLLANIFELVTKIERWWIREVEMTTNPEFDGLDVSDEETFSGTMIFMQLMLRIATGEDSDVWWKEFQSQLAIMEQAGGRTA
jgi:hypothetical protein